MTINIDYETDIRIVPEIPEEEIINKVITQACDYEKCPYEVEVNVLLTDNESIHETNREYRGVDAPTDVLSFPMIDYEAPADFAFLEDSPVEDYFDPDTGELLLGDIVISVEKVMEQAEKYGHSVKRELAFLVAHSMLHLFGYDHMEPDEAEVMEDKQNQILLNIGITRMEDNI
ncbi:rRNA maturation RNase YbeY [[Bacteroides] pectinophilus]|jgi:probable rRNA maturation factor|uniref:Endoribonuclease YbeY n=2 Tax=[Bacteroides] pectinophilus TaxID=384638 RepID=B7AMZ4_9FIRM|nr:translation metalloprotein YbeY [[Bacteroides] pectinophilus ATCC 43243]UWN94482.1 rRNA maturation RNase YbeY [[Bacteroides] pectinophilus]CDD55820.1 probable rRNA maturation factor [Bacteroides pectinophilus CAG:437]